MIHISTFIKSKISSKYLFVTEKQYAEIEIQTFIIFGTRTRTIVKYKMAGRTLCRIVINVSTYTI